MNTEIMRNQVHASIDRHCASLTSDSYRVVRVLRDANAESGGKVRRKVSGTGLRPGAGAGGGSGGGSGTALHAAGGGGLRYPYGAGV